MEPNVLPLRFPWVWLTGGWLLVLGVIVGSLVPGDMLRAITISDKVMHAGTYFLLMVWFAGLYPRQRHFLIAVTLVGLGIALDVAQGGTATRTFDLFDIVADAVGIAIGLILSVAVLGGWCQRVEGWFAVGA
jgi:VanZ family protein